MRKFLNNNSFRHQLLAISIILLLTFPAVNIVCGQQSEEGTSGDWARREFIFCPPDQVEHTVSQMQHDVSEEELSFDALEVDGRFREPLFLTPKAAKDDVERLFYLLENGYSGYGYFEQKGDFKVAKEGILAELDGKVILRGGELSGIIHEYLGFLHDCHLSIGDLGYGEHHDFWFDDSHELRVDDHGYFFEHEGEARTIVSINGEDPEGFVFPSLNPDGGEVLRLGVLSPQPPDPLELVLSDVNESLQIGLVTSDHEYGNLFTDGLVGGVPVVRIGSFSDHHKSYVDQFLDCASKYKDEPCLIVDIRGNGGGNTIYARQWVTRYTGYNPGSIQVYTELVSETSMMGRANYFSWLLHYYPDLEDQGYSQKVDQFKGYSEQIENSESEAHWSSYNVPAAKEIPSNKTLIVLIDSNVGSAAEGFLCYLQQMDNVVLVGENSCGAVIYGQMTMHVLPNSRLQVRLPITLNVFTDLVYREERGFYPDYWVPAGDAVNYAVAAVRSGSISTSESYVDQVSSVEFVPMNSPVKGISVRDVLPVILYLFYGVVIVFFNMKRDWRVFFIGGVVAVFLGIYFVSQNTSLSYVFLFTGVEYLLIALYKRWKRESNR